MKKQRLLATAALAATLALGGVTPALAEPAAIPAVKKALQMNEGSTVTATFSYTIEPKAISTGNGEEKTYTDGPAAAIAPIKLTNATSAANNTGTGAITFGGRSNASAFTHAGVYAWTIKENESVTGGPANGTFQYDPATYTLIATVVNGASGLEFSSIVVAKGDVASVTNADKVSGTEIPFVENKYTENTNDQPDNPNPDNPDNPDNPGKPNTNLVLKKTVTGNQGDKSKQFEFTVTFTAPSILPSGQTAEEVLNAIKPVVTSGHAAIDDAGAASGTTRTIKFKAADAQSITFANLLVGTKYSVTETAAAGYEQSYAAVANGETPSGQANLLVGEKTNTGVMTNRHNDITPTGLILNNLPFIMMGAVAISGVVLYGIAKRKLER